jgi:hypothetical protein
MSTQGGLPTEERLAASDLNVRSAADVDRVFHERHLAPLEAGRKEEKCRRRTFRSISEAPLAVSPL